MGGGVAHSKRMQIALFLVAMAWAGAANAVASKSARGLSQRLQLGSLESLLAGLFLLFLAVVGFQMLDWIATRGRFGGDVLPLPKRVTSGAEWGVGTALGWGLGLAAVLPPLVSGNLHARLTWQAGGVLAVAVSLATLLVVSLAEEVIFRGYPFRRLIDAVGPFGAAVLSSLIFGLVLVLADPPSSMGMALIDETLFGLVLAMAWLRTHALWTGWGVHFAYRAVTGVIFGLPVAGHGIFGSVADMFATGPRWLSGGAYGPDAALLTAVVMLAGMAALYRVTRQYAWDYTFAPIHPGGYEVAVPPPPAHAAMEKAAPPPPLVQILPAAPRDTVGAEGTRDRTPGL